MHPIRCEAVVLATMDYRESDRIVTLFTLCHGKVRGLARGARKSMRRFGGALEPFARLSVELVVREGLSSLRGVDIVTVYPRIRQDLAAIGHGGYAVELVDRLLPDGASVPRLFRLLVSYLEHLDQGGASPSDRRFFEANLLNILGYRLSLDACAACGVEFPADAARRAGAAGTVLCTGCGRYGAPLSAETVRLLHRCLGTGRFGAIVFPPEPLGEAGPLLDGAIGAHLARPLNSLAFLRQLTP
ncbi:DNA repair protein RecO [Geobacter sulfurreducens]|jgi:DNA repair protein RecO (recombination protein O)|uniref:DNA repair protein RecO n=1 Tax=Geobacter sulfurreducens (strain ATCC 51573 / DSM 12127 / PCA) TaxID=243231 RepID=RECO_GEOSL|nr:DNA repair protein RecO [Geobacter sulfurreducens]Q74FM9.1 RecName: Full=DNA repair protein RecO; AltName: Full=Recombination protein O [Geobacter sulfurreducens PCA]AAR33908.1 DNA repair protein RecO [Geobacter sulfurreducens PCA]ADI83418.1 DNA repair protein RecO [Geobacter sulfurreducens KN400]AJY70332.1 DNA recombination protein RecO [Geobacter sulfurreducens]QVW35824.1 DNA repair protein RecO [Geobacter sulfurreducens]UAC04648.1 DNA repair protein RecO [Geobacter sulfurreducens]